VASKRKIITIYFKRSEDNSHSNISSQIKYIKFLNYHILSFIYVRVKLLDSQYQPSYFISTRLTNLRQTRPSVSRNLSTV